jgi:DNA-binding NarL/FixJ family response regulator
MTGPVRVMLVDDHALCRSGLTELLVHRGHMTVVGATGNPDLVVPMLREHQPDLVVLDLRLAAQMA